MRKFFRVIIKLLLGLLLLLAVGFGILYMMYDEPLPQGKTGKQADDLACAIFEAINEPAYREARYVEWQFTNTEYVLDKFKQKVICQWKDYKVTLHFFDSEKNTVLKKGTVISGEKRKQLIAKTYKMYNNDSFWVLAPYKLFDAGTKRALVNLPNDQKGLLITYTSGGSTPGDSYLWLLDENNLPKSFKMWVGLIPIGGLKAKWNDWNTSESGAQIALKRSILNIPLPISKIRVYSNSEDLLTTVQKPKSGLEEEQYDGLPIQKNNLPAVNPLLKVKSLDRSFSQRDLEEDTALIRPHLTEDEINTLAENIFILLNTSDNIELLTYREILNMRLR